MESGILHGEAFATVLRSISQRRRQGVLEIEEENATRRVFFVQGKIVEVLNGDTPPALEVAERLRAAGLINSVEGLPTSTYSGLHEALVGQGLGGAIDLEVFRRAVQHRILDSLYSLNTRSGASYRFSVQITDYEKDLAPAIPAGQILLDMVALQAEAERFAEAFQPGTTIHLASADTVPQGEEEEILCALVEQEISIESLRAKSLLSAYTFQETLLNLYDRGVVTSGAPIEESPGVGKLLGEDALSALDSAIDRTFGGNGVSEDAEQEDLGEISEAAPPLDVFASFDAGMNARLRMWSALALQKAWIPGALAYIFALAAILLPVLFWQGLVAGFGH